MRYFTPDEAVVLEAALRNLEGTVFSNNWGLLDDMRKWPPQLRINIAYIFDTKVKRVVVRWSEEKDLSKRQYHAAYMIGPVWYPMTAWEGPHVEGAICAGAEHWSWWGDAAAVVWLLALWAGGMSFGTFFAENYEAAAIFLTISVALCAVWGIPLVVHNRRAKKVRWALERLSPGWLSKTVRSQQAAERTVQQISQALKAP